MEKINEVHTPQYKRVLDPIRPRIDKFIARKGTDHFNKFCQLVFRRRLKNRKDHGQGKVYTVIFFCFDEQDNQNLINKFRDKFIAYFTDAITSTNELLVLQSYENGQPLLTQFYDPAIDLSGPNPNLPNYFTSSSEEGMVMSTSEGNDPKNVKFSFRYDQMINCRGLKAKIVKEALDPKVRSLFKADECCIAYTVDWNLKPLNDMFCSMYRKTHKCKVDIKFLETTMYLKCMTKNKKKYKDALDQNEGDISKAVLPFTKSAAIADFLKEISQNDLLKYLDQNSQFAISLKDLLPQAKSNLFGLFNGMNCDIRPNNDFVNEKKGDYDDEIEKKRSLTQLDTMRRDFIEEMKRLKDANPDFNVDFDCSHRGNVQENNDDTTHNTDYDGENEESNEKNHFKIKKSKVIESPPCANNQNDDQNDDDSKSNDISNSKKDNKGKNKKNFPLDSSTNYKQDDDLDGLSPNCNGGSNNNNLQATNNKKLRKEDNEHYPLVKKHKKDDYFDNSEIEPPIDDNFDEENSDWDKDNNHNSKKPIKNKPPKKDKLISLPPSKKTQIETNYDHVNHKGDKSNDQSNYKGRNQNLNNNKNYSNLGSLDRQGNNGKGRDDNYSNHKEIDALQYASQQNHFVQNADVNPNLSINTIKEKNYESLRKYDLIPSNPGQIVLKNFDNPNQDGRIIGKSYTMENSYIQNLPNKSKIKGSCSGSKAGGMFKNSNDFNNKFSSFQKGPQSKKFIFIFSALFCCDSFK